MKNKNILEDLYISNNMIIQDDPMHKGKLTCGISIIGIQMENSSNLFFAALEESLRSLLQSLPSEYGNIQVCFTNNAEDFDSLNNYYTTTESKANAWSRSQRNFTYCNINDQVQEGLITRKEVYLYISRIIDQKKDRVEVKDLDTLLQAESSAFNGIVDQIKHNLQLVNGQVERLTNKQLFHELDKTLNPSISPYDPTDALPRFSPERSISECCLHSEMTAIEDSECGFYLDGHHHAVLAMKSLPSITSCGQITQLSSLPIKDFSITLLTSRLDLEQELTQEEDRHSALSLALQSSNKMRLRMSLQQSQDRIDRLSSGDVSPWKVQVIIHCWDKDLNTLKNQKVNVLKSAILRYQQAQPFSINNPVSARNFFLSSLPSSPHSEDDFFHDTEDATVASLLPLSSNNGRSLDHAEALFHTASNGVLPLSLFSNDNGDSYTNHLLCCGTTGFGKSAAALSLITQVQPHTEHIFVIEDGNSYGGFAMANGESASSFILSSNGNDTFNYLDTNKLPLTAQHCSDVTAILKLMIDDEDRHKVSSAKISDLIYRFYRHHYEKWMSGDSTLIEEVRLEFLAAKKYFSNLPKTKQPSMISNAYSDFLEWKNKYSDEYSTIKQSLTSNRSETTEDSFRFTYALMDKNDMPTHSAFYKWVCTESLESKDDREIEILRSNLRLWCVDQGTAGCLFDGISNVNFTKPIVHIELGKIGESNENLKSIAGFIISNYIKNIISSLPRSHRKIVIFEELSSFLNFEHAEGIVADYFARGRKYNVVVMAITQQITDIPEALRNCILNNTSIGLFFRQKNTGDVEVLQKAFNLPDSTTQSLQTLPSPTKETGSSFLCWQSGDQASSIHSARNIVSREMLYVAGSSGEQYEARQSNLAKYDDVLEGISIESRSV